MAALLLAGGLASSVGAASGSPALERLLSAHGLQPVSPPSAAPDFRLPLLRGGEGALSDHGGRWIVLTFWASWCGPCRAEMPSLESLHRQRADAGLSVLGVALDRDAGTALDFAERLGVSFPSFHDAGGRIGSHYRASAIPLSYLIDPLGRIVARAAGARDWMALLPAVDAAIEAVPPGSGVPAQFAASASAAVAPVAEPPTAEVSLLTPDPRPGEPFDLLLRLHWAGEFADYLPQPPVVHLPAGVVRERVTAETSSRDGRHVVSYRVTLRAEKAGRFALDPIELRYTPLGSSEAVATRIAGPTVEVVRSSTGAAVAAAGGAGVALLTLAAVWGARRRRRLSDSGTRSDELARLREQLNAARGDRLGGDAGGFLARLLAIERALEEVGREEEEELERLVEAARFGGRAPSVGEMDRLQRRVERRLESRRQAERNARRRRLLLRRNGGVVEEMPR